MKVLGFLNYNKKFVHKYAEMVETLYRLLQKGKKFEWTEECEKAFSDIKEAIAQKITLAFPETADPYQSYHLETDGSNLGYAAKLSQEIPLRNDKGEPVGELVRQTVAFFSRACPRHKRPWGQTKIEFETMHAAIMHF